MNQKRNEFYFFLYTLVKFLYVVSHNAGESQAEIL